MTDDPIKFAKVSGRAKTIQVTVQKMSELAAGMLNLARLRDKMLDYKYSDQQRNHPCIRFRVMFEGADHNVDITSGHNPLNEISWEVFDLILKNLNHQITVANQAIERLAGELRALDEPS